MVALDKFWPKSVDAIRSITMEVVTAIFALASLGSLLIALRASVICTSLSASELWQFMLSVSAAPAILIGLMIAARMRQTLTALKITHEELVSLAMIDGLTGLLNRPGFDAVAAETFEETRRLGQPVSALVCDIDAFRRLNDTYGYDAGDRVPIPVKPPVCNGMIAPRDSWMMPPPCNEMIPPGAPRLLAERVSSPCGVAGQAVLDCLPRARRRLSPVSSMRCALCTRRSRMASA
jgi:hypothetical protein